MKHLEIYNSLDCKEQSFINEIKDFFKNSEYVNTMLSIIDSENNSRISLRVLDWFVTNYCKKNGTCYKIRVNGNVEIFCVFTDYKAKLKAYNKKYFDPFCRKTKMPFSYEAIDKDGKPVIRTFITSIAQLNFFKWAIKYKVIKYVNNNLDKIEKDMKETNKINKEIQLLSSEKEDDDDKKYLNNISTPDPDICISDNINVVILSTTEKNSTDSEKRKKRHELSQSIYKTIKKVNTPLELNFD
jgi:hypothetical protein